MNKDHVLFHLRGARDAISQCIVAMETGDEYDYGEFVVDVTHIYHHLNTAWNGREATAQQARLCSEEDFNRWRRFPDETEIVL